jgi:RNA polymerase sigma-70 factor (ECF subfamily)
LDFEKLAKGSQEAFRELVEQYSQSVVNTCYSFLKNKANAEDVAQDVFLEVYKSIGGFRKEANFNTWIYRIAINKSIDFLRKQKRRQRISDLRDFITHRSWKKQTDQRPHKELEDAERKQILQSQIQSLPDNQKIALVLKHYKRLSNKEIAHIMQTTEPAVEGLLHRARDNLHRKLEKKYRKSEI